MSGLVKYFLKFYTRHMGSGDYFYIINIKLIF